MRNFIILFVFAALMHPDTLSAQKSPQEKGLEVITMNAIKAQLEYLASDWTEGRETGTRGIFMAGDYVASMFKFSGINGGGDLQRPARGRMGSQRGPRQAPVNSYFQNFTLLEPGTDGSSTLTIDYGNRSLIFKEDVDFRIRRANISSEFSGSLVFIGYGIDSDEFGIHDFTGVDLKGKIAVRLSGYPGINDNESPMYKKLAEDRMAAYMLIRNKDQKLKEMGAIAVIDINPGRDTGNQWGVFIDDMNLSPNESAWRTDFRRLRIDSPDLSDDPISISVTEKVATAVMKNSGIDIMKFTREAAQGSGKFKAVELKNAKIKMAVRVKSRRVKVRNVIAMIEGENKDEIIAVGAHMDHMGMSGGKVWNGADDNASGTVGVMTIARAFAATGVKPKRTVLFCAWTGEEKGLLGSKYFTMHPSYGTIDQYKFYLNFDMIARDATNDTAKVNVGVSYNEDYPELEEISRRNASEYGMKMNFQYRPRKNPTGGSDFTAFTENGIPIIAVMAAMHPEYHTAADEIDLVNWDKMLEVIKLGFLNMWEIANSDF